MTRYFCTLGYLLRLLTAAIVGILLFCIFMTTMALPAAARPELDMSPLNRLSMQTNEYPQTDDEGLCGSEMVVVTEIMSVPAALPFSREESYEKLPSSDCSGCKKQETHACECPQPDSTLPDSSGSSSSQANEQKHGVQWKQLYWQSFLFMSIEHSFRVATQPDTRAMFQGPFFKDYFNSVKGLRSWGDGDPFLTNYIGHGMMGAVTGFMWLNNDPKSKKSDQEFNREYFKHRLRAMTFSAVYSTQFELGLISEASLGNVGLVPGTKTASTMAYTDLVVTPTVGTLWLIGEDALDRYVVRPLENKTSNRFARLMLRSWLNPSRSFANLLRGRWFWYRDNRKL